MSINLNDFLGLHLVLLWLILAVMLLALEMLRGDWTFAVLAISALAASLTAVVVAHAWYAQLGVFVVLVVAGEVVLHRRRSTPGATGDAPTDDV